MISIKGVPSPLTFRTKSTIRTHTKGSSYKECPSLRPVVSENEPISDCSLTIQIKSSRMWDTTAGFMGLRSYPDQKKDYIWQNRVPMTPVLFLGHREEQK